MPSIPDPKVHAAKIGSRVRRDLEEGVRDKKWCGGRSSRLDCAVEAVQRRGHAPAETEMYVGDRWQPVDWVYAD